MDTVIADTADGHLGKPVWNGRQIAETAYAAGWHDLHDLAMAVAAAFAECNAYINSYNDNLAPVGTLPVGARFRSRLELEALTVTGAAGGRVTVIDGAGDERTLAPEALVITSRDVGLWQVNIPAVQITTKAETGLYDPTANAAAAYAIWASHGWGRWASFTSGIVFDDAYVYRAVLAVFNFAAEAMVGAQAGHPDRAAHHSLTVPVVSTHQLHALYPNVPLL